MADLLKLHQLQMPTGAKISLTLPERSVGMLLGEEGSGKGELLQLIAGMRHFESGEIFLQGDLIARSGKIPPPWERPIAWVPRAGGLYPHLSVLDNLRLAVQNFRISNRRDHCMKALDALGLSEIASHLPLGVDAQTLRLLLIARALVTRPTLLLLEEPLIDLAPEGRYRLLDRLQPMVDYFGCSILLTTAVRQGVLFAGDYAGVMENEILLQWGRPQTLYATPQKRTVARYMGECVLVKGVVHDALRLDTELGMIDHPTGFGLPTGTRLELLIRPEDIVFDEKSRRRARIVRRSAQGGKTVYQLQLTPDLEIERGFSSHLDSRISGELRYRLEIRSMVLFKRKGVL
jgi:iron(III) transport system ATP-binding protein